MLVIIHGWSDDGRSFRPLARRLAKAPPEGVGADIAEVHLGDYVSLDDELRYADLVAALDRAWSDRDLPRKPRSVDAVVHSTGGLIIRDWMTQCFAPDTVPIRRLLMLAPANFGSPLAHTGRSLVGRALRGWRGTRLFETGTHILKGLELASPYAEQLAQRDSFGGARWYGPGAVLATVLCGNTGYDGISGIANRPGTDGTVRVASANLNALRIGVDFTGDPAASPSMSQSRPEHTVAFGILDGEDHSSIAGKNRGPRAPDSLTLMRRALRVTDAGYEDWCSELQAHNQSVTAAAEARGECHFHSFHNAVVRAVDDAGNAVSDYIVELYVNDDRSPRDRKRTRRIQEEGVVNVHAYGDDPSRRSLLIDTTVMRALMDGTDDRLYISVTASPDAGDGKVGYRSYSDVDTGHLVVDGTELRALFRAHGTSLITLTLKRHQAPSVFRFRGAR
ncbi:esterase/lipase family protein [Algiphilus aromaticivorans]|uniref:esterase/lipase family protein n=1 Tax=Algiphilus aromaticivorans TaxID=382454 RepID=UPI0005C17855|nr:hypothetical protein [Algiphilus aromaticivorans]